MNTDIVLFVLRLLSAGILIAMLFGLFVVMWRDYRASAREVESAHRTYGRVVVLREVDDGYAVTGESYPLLPLTSLGRSPTNSIRVSDTFASGEHAVVTIRNGQWWLEDRESRNGTLLNGMPVQQPIIVTDGDVIAIGKVHYRLEMEA